MTCVIASPSSGSGKTLLSIILASWARSKKKEIQAFKVGPDYLDPQQLSLITQRPCRNLDLIISGNQWVQESFYKHEVTAELSLIEGAMGLFDGLGSSDKGSTAHIARILKLPVVLIINARGQAASLGALVQGFRDVDKTIDLAGVVLNNVNSMRHKELLIEVLDRINVKVLGCLPKTSDLFLKSKNLGLAPAHEIDRVHQRIEAWNLIAERHLDMGKFEKILSVRRKENMPSKKIFVTKGKVLKPKKIHVAIAEDKAFHFKYPETQECLEELGIEFHKWKILEDEEIPKDVQGLIIPGGFPEQFAQEISQAKRSIDSIKNLFCKRPIYAECGGMLILGHSLIDKNSNKYCMAGILPFNAKEGNLKVGYRSLIAKKNSLLLKTNQKLIGHEFHRWELQLIDQSSNSIKQPIPIKDEHYLSPPWQSKGWRSNLVEEGWSNKLFHASWIHLHWPSTKGIMSSWLQAINRASNN